MQSFKSGPRKKPREVRSSQPGKDRHACVFSFSFSPSFVGHSVVRSSKIEVFRMATVGRGYNELERRRVI